MTRKDPSQALDLRIRCRREAAETIVHRAELLAEDDRGLLEAVYAKGYSVQDIARLLGRTQTNHVRQLRRRIHNLVTRVSDPRFVYVMTCRRRWPATRRQIAERYFLRGMPQRTIAHELGLSLHAVRQHCIEIRAMHEAALAARARRTGSAA